MDRQWNTGPADPQARPGAELEPPQDETGPLTAEQRYGCMFLLILPCFIYAAYLVGYHGVLRILLSLDYETLQRIFR